MTLPASGPISMSMINTEFGRTSTDLITLASASNGFYSILNRNSAAGLSIYNNAISPGNDFFISQFYSLDQGANILFDYDFTNTAASNINFIDIDLGTGNNIISISPLTPTENVSDTNIDTTVSGDGLYVYFSNNCGGGVLVDVELFDVNTNTSLYSNIGANARTLGNGNSIGPASDYYRHLKLTLFYYDP
jgi:hypothetical protein